MTLCIIPARGGSKRFAKKNIAQIANKPLICWTIEAALKSKSFERIIVSTDCKEIAEISKKSGALVPNLRPSELAEDTTTTIDVIDYCLKQEKLIGFNYENFALLQPTSPLRTKSDINNALDLFFKKNACSVVSVTTINHPIEWCNTLPKDQNMLNFLKSQNINKRSQDFSQNYILNGAIYIYKTKRFLEEKKIIFNNKNSYAFIMPSKRSIDIDTKEDAKLAELLLFDKLKNIQNKNIISYNEESPKFKKKLKEKIETIIFGLGNVTLNDCMAKNNKTPPSHFFSIINNNNFLLKGICDPIPKKEKKFFLDSKNIPVFKSHLDIFKAVSPKFVIIASPPSTHLDIIKKVVDQPSVKYILCEKPFGNNISVAKTILKLVKNKKKMLFVNYPRRADVRFSKLKTLISKNLGSEMTINFKYNGHLENIGFHVVDTLHLLFGALKIVNVYGCDLNPSFVVKDNNENIINVIGLNDQFKYLEFEVEAYFKNDYLKVGINGIEFTEGFPKQNEHFYGYKTLSKNKEYFSTPYSFSEVYNEILKHVFGNKKSNLCSMEEAINNHEMIKNIRNLKNENYK